MSSVRPVSIPIRDDGCHPDYQGMPRAGNLDFVLPERSGAATGMPDLHAAKIQDVANRAARPSPRALLDMVGNDPRAYGHPHIVAQNRGGP